MVNGMKISEMWRRMMGREHAAFLLDDDHVVKTDESQHSYQLSIQIDTLRLLCSNLLGTLLFRTSANQEKASRESLFLASRIVTLVNEASGPHRFSCLNFLQRSRSTVEYSLIIKFNFTCRTN